MLQRLRNYVTPIVATLALAVLTATAVAVSHDGDRFTDSDSRSVAAQQQPDTQETADVMEGVQNDDLIVRPADFEEEVTTPTATPANEKPNHGHYVSCVARMANNDPTVDGREKGALVSAAARQKPHAVMAKGDEDACQAAYAEAKAAAAGQHPQGVQQHKNPQGSVNRSETTSESKAGNENASVAKTESPKHQKANMKGPDGGAPAPQKPGQAASGAGGGRKAKK